MGAIKESAKKLSKEQASEKEAQGGQEEHSSSHEQEHRGAPQDGPNRRPMTAVLFELQAGS